MKLGFAEYKEFCRITKCKECDSKSLEKFYSLPHHSQRFLVKKLKDSNYKFFCRMFGYNPDKYFTLEVYDQVEEYFKLLIQLDDAKSVAQFEVNSMIQLHADEYDNNHFERMEDIVEQCDDMFNYIKAKIEEIYEFEQQKDEERGWTNNDIGNFYKKL